MKRAPKSAASDPAARFTLDEKLTARLRDELKGCGKFPTDFFIAQIRGLLKSCEFIEWLHQKEPSRLKNLRRLRDANVGWFEGTYECDAPILAMRFHRLDERVNVELAPFDQKVQAARDAVNALTAEIDVLLSLAGTRTRGRPRADPIGLVRSVAREYENCFGQRPTVAKGSRFSNIVVMLFEHLNGRAPEDVSRHIRQALKDEDSANLVPVTIIHDSD